MNMRRLPFVMLFAASALAVACADTPSGENPPQASGAPVDTGAAPMDTGAAPTSAPSGSAAMTAAPAMSSAAVEAPAPAAKPAKDKIIGKWQFSFEGEPKAKAEEEGKKKFAKEKDTKKLDAFMKEHEDAAAGEWIEFTADTYTSHVTEKGKDKVVLEVKYEVVKDDNTTLVTKAGKDKPKVGKIDPKVEITTKFRDDSTIEMKDPVKNITLVFKKK